MVKSKYLFKIIFILSIISLSLSSCLYHDRNENRGFDLDKKLSKLSAADSESLLNKYDLWNDACLQKYDVKALELEITLRGRKNFNFFKTLGDTEAFGGKKYKGTVLRFANILNIRPNKLRMQDAEVYTAADMHGLFDYYSYRAIPVFIKKLKNEALHYTANRLLETLTGIEFESRIAKDNQSRYKALLHRAWNDWYKNVFLRSLKKSPEELVRIDDPQYFLATLVVLGNRPGLEAGIVEKYLERIITGGHNYYPYSAVKSLADFSDKVSDEFIRGLYRKIKDEKLKNTILVTLASLPNAAEYKDILTADNVAKSEFSAKTLFLLSEDYTNFSKSILDVYDQSPDRYLRMIALSIICSKDRNIGLKMLREIPGKDDSLLRSYCFLLGEYGDIDSVKILLAMLDKPELAAPSLIAIHKILFRESTPALSRQPR